MAESGGGRAAGGRTTRGRMSARHAARTPRQPGDRTVKAGALLFGLGVLGVLAVVVPFLLGREDAPLWTTLVASLLPVGLGLSLLGLLRGARARRRRRSR